MQSCGKIRQSVNVVNVNVNVSIGAGEGIFSRLLTAILARLLKQS